MTEQITFKGFPISTDDFLKENLDRPPDLVIFHKEATDWYLQVEKKLKNT